MCDMTICECVWIVGLCMCARCVGGRSVCVCVCVCVCV